MTMAVVMIAIIIIVVLIVLFTRKEKTYVVDINGSTGTVSGDLEMIAQDSLMALVDTQEEAEEIASLYGITLTEFKQGVATYYTYDDPYEVVKRGETNGYPPISINYLNSIQ
ncbi:MAG: hypothetical protein GX567_07265 [Clostridia bacterium]|nr:hypothetical protein [Clostridia bacterium]